MKKLLVSLVIVAVMLTQSAMAKNSRESYDKIAAVVDGNVILESDIMEALYQYSNMPGFGTLDGDSLKAKVLDKLIDEKIILAKARLDTMLVSQEEMNELVDNHIAKLSVNFPNKEQLAQRIKSETGMTMSKFREYVGAQLEQQAILNKVRGKYIGRIAPTPKDVQVFYTENKEKLPKQYNCVKLRKLKLDIQPGFKRLDSVRTLADSLITELDKGVPFDSLADDFSQDYSTGVGGDLGFFKKGAHDPDFERYAFRLQVGRYTAAPVKTKKGFHVIKLLQRQDNEIQAAHIFLAVAPDSKDTLNVKQKLDSLNEVALKEKNYATLAQQFSDDIATQKNGGLLGWFEKANVPPEIVSHVANLKENDISVPFIIEDSWNSILVEKTLPVRDLTLEDDWTQLEMMALNALSQEKLEGYLKKWRGLVYVNIVDENLKKVIQQ